MPAAFTHRQHRVGAAERLLSTERELKCVRPVDQTDRVTEQPIAALPLRKDLGGRGGPLLGSRPWDGSVARGPDVRSAHRGPEPPHCQSSDRADGSDHQARPSIHSRSRLRRLHDGQPDPEPPMPGRQAPPTQALGARGMQRGRSSGAEPLRMHSPHRSHQSPSPWLAAWSSDGVRPRPRDSAAE